MRQVTQRLCALACLRALVTASWAIRSSSVSASIGSRTGVSSRTRCTVRFELAPDLTDVVRQGRPEPDRGLHLAAQVEDRQPQLGDDAGQLAAQGLEVRLEVGQVPGPGGQVVDDVAHGGELLGDAVVDLAGEPAAFLGGGEAAHLAEQQRRLQSEAELFQHVLGLGDLRGLERRARSVPEPPVRRFGARSAAVGPRDTPASPGVRGWADRIVVLDAHASSKNGVSTSQSSRSAPTNATGDSRPPVERTYTAPRSNGRRPLHGLQHLLGERHRVEAARELTRHEPAAGRSAGTPRRRPRSRSARSPPAAAGRSTRPAAPRPT